jgi:PAS domain-containing protein
VEVAVNFTPDGTMSETPAQQRVRLALQRLATFEQQASARGIAVSTEPILAGIRRHIGALERDCVDRTRPASVDLGSLQRMPAEVWCEANQASLPVVVVDHTGYVSDANKSAAQLLQVSVRFLRGRPLQLFIGEERARFSRWLLELRAGGLAESMVLLVRPRERRPKHVSVLATVDADDRIHLLMCEGVCDYSLVADR